MAVYNLIGRPRCSAVSKKKRVNVLLLQFQRIYKILVKILIETNIKISNELIFSDVYRSVNYTGSLAKLS